MHTWLHRHSSILTNEQLVGDFGWTLQIIHDSTGGRVPRYWRPPYGDADNRVRAIAKEVFGLTTVVWNQDSQDWTMAAGTTTLPAIQTAFTGWLNGPRTPGLIVLEHEITGDDVSAFINMYPLIASAGGGAPWQPMSVAQLFDGHTNNTQGEGWYQNSNDNTASVTGANILLVSTTPPGATSTGNATAPTATPTTSRSGAILGRRVSVGGGLLGVGGVAMASLLAGL
jgi:chitin deacetylase